MKKIYILFAAFLMMGLIITFSTSGYFDNKNIFKISKEGIKTITNLKKPEYHFALICQNIDEPFWKTIKKGALEASNEFNVAVEFYGPRFTNINEELQYLDMAIASRVDGIVTHVLNENQFSLLIDKAAKYDIPVVTIEADAKNSKRAAFVGTNSYKLGTEWGKQIIQATSGQAVVAMIISNVNGESENTVQNLMISGLKDSVKKYPFIKVKTVQANKNGIFSAEEVTKDILNKFDDVNVILCISANDTIGAAQVLVDFNKVGNITIIGYDNTPDILRYIEKGVIYGTVASNPNKMGYESIKSLIEIKKKNRTSSYVSTDVHPITVENLNEYKLSSDKN